MHFVRKFRHTTGNVQGRTAQKSKRKKSSCVARVKLIILIFGMGIFLYVAITTFFDTREFFQGSWTGQATAATTKTSLHLLVEATPWPVQALIAGCGLYLWVKHKWIMSAVLGVLAGIWLAL